MLSKYALVFKGFLKFIFSGDSSMLKNFCRRVDVDG